MKYDFYSIIAKELNKTTETLHQNMIFCLSGAETPNPCLCESFISITIDNYSSLILHEKNQIIINKFIAILITINQFIK